MEDVQISFSSEDADIALQEDLEYFRQKIMISLRVPIAYTNAAPKNPPHPTLEMYEIVAKLRELDAARDRANAAMREEEGRQLAAASWHQYETYLANEIRL